MTINSAQIVRSIESDIDAEVLTFGAIASKHNISKIVVVEIYEQMVLREINKEWETFHAA